MRYVEFQVTWDTRKEVASIVIGYVLELNGEICQVHGLETSVGRRWMETEATVSDKKSGEKRGGVV